MKFVRSSLLVKILVLIIVVYATVTLVTLRGQLTEQKERAALLTSSIAAVHQENSALQDAIASVDTDAGVEAIAREKLGMVSDGEVVFYDISN